MDNLHDKDVVVATTGMLSRELFEYRVSKCQGHEKDFLCVGSMGHASAIALGIAKKKRNRQVNRWRQYEISIDIISHSDNSYKLPVYTICCTTLGVCWSSLLAAES